VSRDTSGERLGIICEDSRIFERVREGDLDMAIIENDRARRPSSPLKAWTITVLAGFGILHVVGAYMLHHAQSIGPVQSTIADVYGD
jgi:hypothetical protein